MLELDYLKSRIDKIEDWVIGIRRDFHQYPELGFEEYRTRDKIIEYLNELGIENRIVAGTGVVGIIRGGKRGKTVAIRADIDALPMEDRKDVSYKSKINGKMHSCGHDAHAAILLGIARVLNDVKEEMVGNVKLLFQPSEESSGGALPMINEGVLEEPYVDGIFGLHVDNSISVGEIGIKYGKMKAASDSIKIIIHGKSSHGAYPQDGIDAIIIAGQALVSLQTVISRNIDPRSSAVLTIGTIEGGYSGNIIADRVEMVGMVRTLDKTQREQILQRIEHIIKHITQSLGGNCEIIKKRGYDLLINDDEMVNIIKRNGIELFGNKNIHNIPCPSFGVEDFAFFAAERPAAYFHLGSGNKEKGIIHGGHTSYFDIDERCLSRGILIQIKNALEFLKA